MADKTIKALDQTKLNRYLHRIEAAEKHRDNGYKELWNRCYKRYRNYVDQLIDPATGKVVTDRSNISIPYTFVQIETVLPRIIETLFASRPYVSVKDREPSDLSNAQNMETLLDWQMCERMDMMDNFHHGIKGLCIYGTAVAFTGWKWKQESVIQKQPTPVIQKDPMTGEPITDPMTGQPIPIQDEVTGEPVTELQPFQSNMVTYDDPDARFIDLGLFYVDPQATDIDDARYCGHEEFMTKEELQELADQGVLTIDWDKVPKDKCYNKARAERMNSVGIPTGADDIDENDDDNLYEVHYYWEDNKKVVILNRSYLAMDGENPYWHHKKPYDKGVYTLVPGEFYGMGIPESVMDLQDELNTERNMRIDYRAFILRRMFKVRRNSNVKASDLRWRQGGIIYVDEMDDVMEIGMGDASSSSFATENGIKQDIQDTTGAHDVVMGTQTTKQTATETMTKDNNASMRFKMTISAIEKRLLCGIARKMMKLNQQFVDNTRILRLTNDQQGGWVKLSPEDIMGEFDLYPAGSSVEPIANKEAYKQRMIELYNVVTNDPLMQDPMKRRNLLKKIFESFDFKDIDAVLPTDQEIMAQQQQQAQAQAMAQMVAGAAGAGGGPPVAAPGSPNTAMQQEGGLTRG